MLIPNGFLDVEFGKSMAFGYKTTDVDIFVDAAIELLKEFEKENIKLTETLEKTQAELKSYKDDENTIRQALIGSQKLGDSLIHKAKVQADEIIADATKKANDILDGVESKKLQKEYEYNRTKDEVSKFKNNLLVLYKQHLEILQQIPEEPDAPKNNHTDEDINNQSDIFENSENTDEDLSYIKDDEFYLNRIKHYETLMNSDENAESSVNSENSESSVNSETSQQNDNETDTSLNDDNLQKDESDSNIEHTFTESQNSENDFEEKSTVNDTQEDISKTENSDANNCLSENLNDAEQPSTDDDDVSDNDITELKDTENVEIEETEVTDDTANETKTDSPTEKKLFDTLICEQIETSVVLNEDDDYNMFLDDIDLEDINAKQMDLFSDESEEDEQKLTY